MSATCGLDCERQLSASGFDVRRAIAEAVRELGFEISVDQLTRIEAKRGGMLGYSLLIKKQMPVLAVFEVLPEVSSCRVVCHLTDNVKNLGKTFGINRQYRGIFDEVQGRVDLGLAGLDGAASQAFAEPVFWSRSGDIGVLEQTNALTAKAVGGAVGVAGKALDSPAGTTPKVWKGVDSVTFTSSAGVAALTLAETQARLGVAVMVASHPGSMPPNLARDVEALAAAIEIKLTAAGGKAATVEVPDAQLPVFDFLNQQAEIRSGLPLRQLHICRSCRLEKITNPEYQRIATRNEKIGDIMAGVGATISKGGISPTFVLGQVFKLKRLDPAYVCSRCQGMEADERIVTFCPSCADLARDVVLRTCPKCKFDYRTRAGKESVWSTPVVEPETQTSVEPEVKAEAQPTVEPVLEPEVEPKAEAAEAGAEPLSAVETVDSGAVEPIDAADEAVDSGVDEPDPQAALAPAAPAAPAKAVPAPAAPSAPTPAPVPPAVTSAPTPAPLAPAPVAPVPPPGYPPAPVRPWAAAQPPAPMAWPRPAQVPLGRPQTGRRGKVCQMCRREYPTLWRVVIATPAGYEERFLCGTTATCQMTSLVTAVPV